jgi:NAD(P)-dependent dehydrogenase (short-subunit alcohol dehydrogenase family)
VTGRMKEIIAPGRVALVTGGGKGIGAAIAGELSQRGMKLALLDNDAASLQAVAGRLGPDVVTEVGDATDERALLRLRNGALHRFGAIHLLVNNVGMMKKAGPWDPPETWWETFAVNFTSALLAQSLFLPSMVAGDQPGAVVNLGSKEGITTPPGNAAYSVAKAGIKVLTEQTAHELRNLTGGRISAHLLVPGYTWTPMNFPGMDARRDTKPAAPWTAEQMVDYFVARLLNEDFYILTPDNEVTVEMDARRMAWSAGDMTDNRPALSRWHPDWKDRFATWMRGQGHG